MADEANVTTIELNALVGKLATMSTSFSEQECAALAALVALAGDGIAAAGDEVEGFGAFSEGSTIELHFSLGPADVGSPPILIGLLKNGTSGLGGVNLRTP